MSSIESSSVTPAFEAERSFPMYLIYSKKPLNYLSKIISSHGDTQSYLRVVKNKAEDTNRTIALISSKAYQNLCNDGYNVKGNYPHFYIQPYRLNQRDFYGEGQNRNLFVPVPPDMRGDYDFVTSYVEDRLELLVEWGIIEPKSWSLKVPIKSRRVGDVKGGCFIIFNDSVHDEQIATARLLLHDSYWPVSGDDPSESDFGFRCVWAQTRKPHVKKDEASNQPKPPKQPKTIVKLNAEERRTKTLLSALQKLPLTIDQPNLLE